MGKDEPELIVCKMRIRLLPLFLFSLLLSVLARAELVIPRELQSKLDALVQRLNAATKTGEYEMKDYLSDLKEIGKHVEPQLRKEIGERKQGAFFEALLLLTIEVADATVDSKITELND